MRQSKDAAWAAWGDAERELKQAAVSLATAVVEGVVSGRGHDDRVERFVQARSAVVRAAGVWLEASEEEQKWKVAGERLDAIASEVDDPTLVEVCS